MRKFPFPFRVLLVSSNFCRANEPRDAYGASCLANAFKLGFANDGAHLDVFTCDLNRFQDRTSGDYRIDWKLVADEIMANIRIGGYDVVAFSVFGWFE